MSTRLNDIANELNERAHELEDTSTPLLKEVARDLHAAAASVRLADRRGGDEPVTGVHRVTFILLGNEDAARRFVRRMLDAAGLTELAFKIDAGTQADLDERNRAAPPIIGAAEATIVETAGSKRSAVFWAGETELAALRGLWFDNERLRLETLRKGGGFLVNTMAQALTARSDLLARLYRDLTGREISPA